MNPICKETQVIRGHRMFRMILTAMSHPGSVYPVPDLEQDTDPLTSFLGCIMDNEVGFAVIDDHELEARLLKMTGSRPSPVSDADFIIALQGSTQKSMDRFKRGTLEYPDQGATVVYRVETLGYGNLSITLTGPGVDGETDLDMAGLDLEELGQLKDVNIEFPLGIDALFIDRTGRIAAIPRSSQIGVN